MWTHTFWVILKQTKKQREKRASGEGKRSGEPWESDKTVQWVHGDRRPLGTRKAEKRIQVLSNIHLTLPVCLFIFFFSVNHPFCKSTYLTYFLLFQCFSLLRKDGWESGKKERRCHYTSKGGLQMGIARADGKSERHRFIGIHTSAIWLPLWPLCSGLGEWEMRREEGRQPLLKSQKMSVFLCARTGIKERLSLMTHTSVDGTCYETWCCPLELEVRPVYFVISTCRYSRLRTRNGCLVNKLTS